MADLDDATEYGIGDCLETLGIEHLCQWDVLVFLHRHHACLVGGELVAHYLGYPQVAVTDALSRLDFLGLIRRSRASQGVRLYEFRRPDSPSKGAIFDHLLGLAGDREGRLELIGTLRLDDRRPRISAPRPGGEGGRLWPR